MIFVVTFMLFQISLQFRCRSALGHITHFTSSTILSEFSCCKKIRTHAITGPIQISQQRPSGEIKHESLSMLSLLFLSSVYLPCVSQPRVPRVSCVPPCTRRIPNLGDCKFRGALSTSPYAHFLNTWRRMFCGNRHYIGVSLCYTIRVRGIFTNDDHP